MDMDRTLDNEEEHLLDTIGRPRMRSHQPRLMGIANIGSPNVVKVLIDNGRVLAKIIEQMGGTTMHEPPSNNRHDQDVSI